MTVLIEPVKVNNRLLALLPTIVRGSLLACSESVELTFGEILCQPHQDYQHVYFPVSSFISLVTQVTGHKPLEMGLIGNEGMLGVTLTLGIIAVPTQAIVQGSGMAWRIKVVLFQELLQQYPELHQIFQRYLFVLLQQLSQSAACAHFHSLEQRLARWLLMSQDRAHADQVYLTQVFLADMLGVRRSGITVAAHRLQHQQIIRYSRGTIQILNRPALLLIACECYQITRDDYTKRLGETAP